MQFSPLQVAIFDHIENGKGNGIANAVAGSGKTTTIVEAYKRATRGVTGQAKFLAFNRNVVTELKTRGVDAQTLNGLGAGALYKAFTNAPELDADKVRKLIDDFLPTDAIKKYGGGIAKLVGLAKGLGIVPIEFRDLRALTPDDIEIWRDLIVQFDIDIGDHVDASEDELIDFARLVLTQSLKRLHTIDFDDQKYLPVVMGLPPRKFKWVFLDECQDLNIVDRELVKMAIAPGGRLFAVGDPCQPGSSQVLTPTGAVPISSLKIGDLVVGFNPHDASFIMKGRRVNGITRRPYDGRMIHVRTAANESRYTPNHICWAKLESLKNKYLVYLMQRGADFRIGMCRAAWKNGSGLSTRVKLEKADRVWILEALDTKHEATIREKIIAARYCLPELTFAPVNSEGPMDQGALDIIWAEIGDNIGPASLALRSYGRMIDYPLYDRGADFQFAFNRYTAIRACNLMDGMFVREFQGTARVSGQAMAPITVTDEQHAGFVYSLDVEGEHLYVADGITTHNCQAIYGWRGADVRSFDLIKEEFDCQEFPLSVCYRCPTEVLDMAKQWVPHITPRDGAPAGEIRYPRYYDHETLKAGDLVMCRNNAPLISLAYKLMGQRKPVIVLGRDFGKQIMTLVDKLGKGNPAGPEFVPELLRRVELYKTKEIEKALARRMESKVARVSDLCEAIFAIVESADVDGPEGISNELGKLFSDDARRNAVTLSTIHKMKGGEADDVFILDWFLLPSKFAKSSDAYQQELNLQYVAVTRSRSTLTFIETKSYGKKPEAA